ncbi:BREX-1 system adenine-specific DNA-methyltransferase PglX [Mesorhizobium sp. M1312]|uniref:BREX-1 system adenine-specific DNA-methyltransferase PglX n=1 Tax=unclassified Mesorhizobium TaxID=325217 RepID=UPI003338EB27
MAFDQTIRSRLQRFVNDARKTLEEEFTRQLQLDYGLDPRSGTIGPIENLRHLTDAQRETARILRDTLDHYCAGHDTTALQGLERIVREQAFTILNRLAALRMAEARGLLIESVGNGYQAKGFQLYARLAGAGLGETAESYVVYLHSVFDELAQDLPSLFSRFAPQGRLFPREPALLQLLNLINQGEIEPLWAEDETIGWIYQYFNSKEERRSMRDASQAPRNSRELAVRNQFFTPRYVVEFLVDNTLGRLWFDWTGGQTGLGDRCQYLLAKQDGKSAAPERLRDPRTIKLLDPACGSMHFGLYAFDLFLEIYREAWEWEQVHGPGCLDTETGGSPDLKSLCQTYPDKAAFLHDVPRLIIEHNIYGVDIDPRAAQIASLALWLRAQRAWHDAGMKAKNRPQVGRGHVMAAIAPPAEVELRKRFMEELDHLDAMLFEKTLFLLKGLPELGMLLQVEKELPSLIRSVFGEHGDLFKAEDKAQWQQAEARLQDALSEFAQAARSTYQGRLFADDALQGLRIIDLCREIFDVVVMNPPFGEPSPHARSYLRRAYPLGYIDLYTAFLDRAVERVAEGGRVGAITSRTALTLSSFTAWRRRSLLGGGSQIEQCADLGVGVLDDAMVETAAYTIIKSKSPQQMHFVDLDRISEKSSRLADAVKDGNFISLFPGDFLSLPNATMAYFLDRTLRQDFQDLPSIGSFASVLGGNATSDDERFIRCFWEVDPERIVQGTSRRWRWISKGGEYSLFYTSIHLVVDWRDDGNYLGEYMYDARPRNGYLWGPKSWSSAHMGKPGVVWSLRSQKGVSFRALPADCAMSGKSAIVTTGNEETDLELLGILNTERLSRLARCFATFGSYEKGAISGLPVELNNASGIAELAKEAFVETSHGFSNFETDPFFCPPRIDASSDIATVVRKIQDSLTGAETKVGGHLGKINGLYRDQDPNFPSERVSFLGEKASQFLVDDLLSQLVGFVFGRWDLRFATGERPRPAPPVPFAPLPTPCPGSLCRQNEGEALQAGAHHSYPIEIPKSGILVDDPGHSWDVEQNISKVMKLIWPDRFDSIEREICQLLRMQSVRDYIRSQAGFFQYHFSRYSKSRRQAPIYWPLSTVSCSYTLWVYYPALTNQTLYTAVNEFVEPKLKQVEQEVSGLRTKFSSRSREEDKRFEALQTLEGELIELRDTLLQIAPIYRPSHDDGVQITAAPLWPLFRHKPWQKVLKDIWAKLEKGDYDWAHLAMGYWPDRVRQKCKTDKSLAIAHGLDELYVEPSERNIGKKKEAAA